MSTKKNETGDLLLELAEAAKLERKTEDNGPYSITYDFGEWMTVICC